MFRVPVNVTKKKSVILFAPGINGEQTEERARETKSVCVSQFTHVVDLIAVAGVGGVMRPLLSLNYWTAAVPITCLGKVIGGSGVV